MHKPRMMIQSRRNSKTGKYSTQLVENTQVQCKNGKMAIPKVLQDQGVSWYHHYLQHPGNTCLEEMIHVLMYWNATRCTTQSHVKNCHTCQNNKWHKDKYGKLPAELVITNPREALCADLIGPYTLKVNNGTDIDFMCLTMIDPVRAGLK